MRTVSDIKTAFEGIVSRHLQLKKFYTNSLEEMDVDKMDVVNFPLLYAQVSNAEIGVGFTEFTYQVIVADLVIQEQLPNLDMVYTDTLLMMQDVIAALYNTDYSAVNSSIGISMPVTCTPFTASYNNLLTGWDVSLSIRVPNALELCEAPFTS